MSDVPGVLEGRTVVEVLATSTGGVGTHVRGLIPFLTEAGCDARVAGPQSTQDLFRFTEQGAAFAPVEIALGLRPLHDAAAVRRLRAATADADLVHAHGMRAATVAVTANLQRRTPLVVTLHNEVGAQSSVAGAAYAAIERFVSRGADLVIGASPDLVARARECGARRSEYIEVAAPPLPQPRRGRTQTRRDLRIADDQPLLLSVGRLHPQKGYDTLMHAARSWRDHPSKPEVVIAGDGPLRDQLQRQIDADHLRARLLGRRDDVADLLAAADLVLLPSTWEARSLTAQEAMRAGVALVCTKAGGMGELVGDAAWTIPVGDADALADAVRTLIEQPQRRAELARAGRERAATFPTVSDTASSLIDRYAGLLRHDLAAPRS